jgi:hypothetical protein
MPGADLGSGGLVNEGVPDKGSPWGLLAEIQEHGERVEPAARAHGQVKAALATDRGPHAAALAEGTRALQRLHVTSLTRSHAARCRLAPTGHGPLGVPVNVVRRSPDDTVAHPDLMKPSAARDDLPARLAYSPVDSSVTREWTQSAAFERPDVR